MHHLRNQTETQASKCDNKLQQPAEWKIPKMKKYKTKMVLQ
jgi:hypothetical protein